MNKPVIITGATGVVGYGLAKRYLDADHPVISPLRRNPNPTALRLRRGQALVNLISPNLVIQQYNSVFERSAIEQTARVMKGSEVLYHLGGWSGHKIAEAELPEAMASNVLWTGMLVKLAIGNDIKRLVFASTRAIYDFNPPEQREVVTEKTGIELSVELVKWKAQAMMAFNEYLNRLVEGAASQMPEEFCRQYLAENPLNMISGKLWYPLTKLMGEEFVNSAWGGGVEGINLRLKPVFGPSPVEMDSRIIPKIVRELKNKGIATAWPERSGFLYLDDLINALVNLNPAEGSAQVSRDENLFLLGNPFQNLSQLSLFWMIADILKDNYEISYDPFPEPRKDEVFDVSLAQQRLGFQATPFSEALERTVKYFAG